MEMLKNFVSLCKDASPWSTAAFASRTVFMVRQSKPACVDIEADVKAHVGTRNVFILVSGGVDSTVAYTLLQKVLDPSRVYGLLVDTGALRGLGFGEAC
jgi:GMP synthase (glutamine-hydrolysing)